jgi:hypothetical protein
MSANLNNNMSRKEEDKWNVKAVEAYFEEVVSTLNKLPPVKQKGYFNSWPDIVYTPNEILFQEKQTKRLQATPEAISRLERTFDWMRWISIEERKLIWKRAAKIRWKVICWELGCSEVTANKRWNIALNKIAKKLNILGSWRR